jgi:hypothetical protein
MEAGLKGISTPSYIHSVSDAGAAADSLSQLGVAVRNVEMRLQLRLHWRSHMLKNPSHRQTLQSALCPSTVGEKGERTRRSQSVTAVATIPHHSYIPTLSQNLPHFHHLIKRDFHQAYFGPHINKAVGLEGPLNQLVVPSSFSRNGPRELIVIDAQRFKPPVPDEIIARGKSSDESVVVQVEVPEVKKAIANIGRKCSRQLVAPDVEIKAATESQVIRECPGKLIRI